MSTVNAARRPPAPPVWTDRDDQVAEAFRAHRWDVARDALNQGVNVLGRDGDGNTLLMTLLDLGHRKALVPEVMTCARQLLQQGADPNALNPDGTSLLYAAMDRHLWPVVKLLVEHGVDPDENLPEDSESVLQRAVQLADADTVRTLLDHGADPNRLRDDRSPLADLMWAFASWGAGPAAPRLHAVLDLLLERGASVIGAGPDGLPKNPMSAPLVQALPPPAMAALQRLLDLGALRDDPRWDHPARIALLLTAVREGHAGSITALLDAGVAQDFDQHAWSEFTRTVAQHGRFGVGTVHHSPTEQARAQARLDGIRAVIERAALQRTMKDAPSDTIEPLGRRARL